MKKLLVLIPNYNGGNFIKNTVIPFKEGCEDCEVLVVDDKSTDQPLEYLNGLADHCIYRKENGGYAPAVNEGLNFFINNAQFDKVMITNSDILIDIEKVKEISDVINTNFKDKGLGILGFLENTNNGSEKYEDINLSGFLFVISREVVEKVGLLDEGFYMYGEEQDYFARVKKAGFKLVQSGSIVNHQAEGSGKSNLKNSWFAIRNSILLNFKEKNILLILKKITSLFLLINKLYKPSNLQDPSYIRITRPGLFMGNCILIGAIIWNLKVFLIGRSHE